MAAVADYVKLHIRPIKKRWVKFLERQVLGKAAIDHPTPLRLLGNGNGH